MQDGACERVRKKELPRAASRAGETGAATRRKSIPRTRHRRASRGWSGSCIALAARRPFAPSPSPEVPNRMPPLFSPRADRRLRLAVFAGGSLALAALAALMIGVRMPEATGQWQPVEQPLQFDHRHHVNDDGIDCRYCHYAVDRSPYAGVPASSLCMGCHAQIWSRSTALAPLRESYFAGRPIVWNRVHVLPGYVYFNHAVHVKKGVGCAECHGRVDEMALIFQEKTLTMGWCLECHRDPEPHLRPPDKITDMAWRAEGDRRELGRRLARELGVRARTTCSTCHR